MDETIMITVHQCQVCGDHSRDHVKPGGAEVPVWEGCRCTEKYEKTPDKVLVDEVLLVRCPNCRQLVCCSCLADRWCCERAGRLENQQMPLFPEKP